MSKQKKKTASQISGDDWQCFRGNAVIRPEASETVLRETFGT